MFDAQRLKQLTALGIEPLMLRPAAPGLTGGEAVPPGPDAAGMRVAAGKPRPPSPSPAMPAGSDATPDAMAATTLRLWLPDDAQLEDAFAGPHARLLRDVFRALGLAITQATTGADAQLPILAFGPGAPEGAVRLAALARLRDPIEKRIAWSALRRLRRRLREAGA